MSFVLFANLLMSFPEELLLLFQGPELCARLGPGQGVGGTGLGLASLVRTCAQHWLVVRMPCFCSCYEPPEDVWEVRQPAGLRAEG